MSPGHHRPEPPTRSPFQEAVERLMQSLEGRRRPPKRGEAERVRPHGAVRLDRTPDPWPELMATMRAASPGAPGRRLLIGAGSEDLVIGTRDQNVMAVGPPRSDKSAGVAV